MQLRADAPGRLHHIFSQSTVRRQLHQSRARTRHQLHCCGPPARRLSSTSSHHETETSTKAALRDLLRQTAQPVAVVTALLPPPTSVTSSQPLYHGATLSSFTSVALDPHPLVAFSLRVPSRMASSLSHFFPSSPPSSPTTSSTPRTDLTPHLVINLLSASQSSLAHTFARADPAHAPFDAPGVHYDLTSDGLPVLRGALGALSCSLVGASWPLHDLAALSVRRTHQEGQEPWAGAGVASELYIARVTRVEEVVRASEDELQGEPMPLLYHHRGYCTVGPGPHPDPGPKKA
ncbi:hypothetical protein PUNSTDRAFT_143157 [Punctularia strigosozonata HHB-11173 SS5]|uniref:uncharacterized protein n=1 Tax=Punctularia strigosozonata (strain HHB-11173) TaxID=741275 RepID=UPI000441761C|nr:uncharacterized protein PUNSTDRAFT_143157 [Punctularia strigosozonata HHB-11173 SS5]EIN09670.1 hypothetical protein PUNSTDRAFT_143157 [Punctularia strigosozonata HHB-11173 SS5]